MKKGHLLGRRAGLRYPRARVGRPLQQLPPPPEARGACPWAPDTAWGAPVAPDLPPLLTPLLTCSSKKREGELTVAQGRVKDLESLFHRSEAELAAALSDKRVLESDLAELRAQLAKAGLRRQAACGGSGLGRVSSPPDTPCWSACPRGSLGPQKPHGAADEGRHLACWPVSPRRRMVMPWPKSSWRRRR